MTEIKLLSEKTIGKIAAGEVVERPASVVKELIENSLDAGADRIAIMISEGGIKRISILDNGEGMTKDNAVLAFHRHATSKIAAIEDLDRLNTLGFRGEAIACIAAVARVELVTRRKGEDTGTRIVVEAGEIKENGPIGCPEGTKIDVTDLFYNVPARRKYLKSRRTELAHIQEAVTERTLIYPQVHFNLVHDGNVLLSSPSSGDIREKLAHIFGQRMAKEMVKVDDSVDGVKVSGFLSPPHFARSSFSNLFVSINGRPVRETRINKAVTEGYKTLLMKNRYPLGAIALEISPDQLDVNVHPAKIEVRFMNERDVLKAVTSAVTSAFSSRKLSPVVNVSNFEFQDASDDAFGFEEHSTFEEVKHDYDHTPQIPTVQAHLGVEAEETVELGGGMSVLGQLWKTYILLERGDEFILLDQHAAHERVRYEALKSSYAEDNIRTQELITPLTMELRPKEFALIMDENERLTELGIQLEEFGTNTIQVRGLPLVLGKAGDDKVVRGLLDDLLSMGRIKNDEDFSEKVLRLMACHSAIRAGEVLDASRIKKLLKELEACENPYCCPHGRPVSVLMSRAEMEKKFKRRV